jgi:stage II sporulation protein AB (anti-sigma F factor)
MEKNLEKKLEKKLLVQLDGILENQSLARSITAAYVSQADPNIEELTEIKTAVSEAFSNAAIHGYKGESGIVTMELGFASKDTVVIKVVDNGVGIENIKKAMEPLFTTDDGQICSGMGFTVMESFMDKIKVESNLGMGTTVTMIKKLDTYYEA